MYKKFISHTLVYGMANQLPKILGIVALPIITQNLTERDFGIYGIVLAYASSMEVLTTLGMRVVVQNTYYKFGGRFLLYWRHIYGFLIAWTFFYAVLHFTVIRTALPETVEERSLIAVLSVGASLFFSPVALMGSSYYQFKERPMVIASIGIVSGIIGVSLNVFFISYLKLGYMGWFWSSLITSMLINAVYLFLVVRFLGLFPAIPFNIRFIRRSLKISLPTIPHIYSMFLLNSSDRLVMNLNGIPADNIGRYNVAYTAGNVFQSLVAASGFAITPLMMRCYKDDDEAAARQLVFFLQGIFLSTTFIACIWMKEIFGMLIRNEGLSEMYYLGIVITMSFNYRPIYYGAVNRLIFLERTSTLWQLSLIPAAINVLLNVIFLPMFGYEFAALSTFATYSLMGVLGYFKRNVYGVRYYAFAWALVNILLTVVAYLCRDIGLFEKLTISLIFGVLFTVVFLRLLRLKSRLVKVNHA